MRNGSLQVLSKPARGYRCQPTHLRRRMRNSRGSWCHGPLRHRAWRPLSRRHPDLLTLGNCEVYLSQRVAPPIPLFTTPFEFCSPHAKLGSVRSRGRDCAFKLESKRRLPQGPSTNGSGRRALTPQSAPTRNSVIYSWRCLTHEHHPRERLVVGAVLWRNSRPERPAGSGHNAPGQQVK